MSTDLHEPTEPAPPGDADPVDRWRLVALGLVAVVAVVALVVGLLTDGDPATVERREAPELAALRAAADLEPCPEGLGPQMPDLELPCLGGGDAVDLDAAPPGRPTLVNLWASWCAPCVDEVPVLAKWRERVGDDVGLVGVLYEDSAVSALTFAAEHGMTWPSVVDDLGQVKPPFGAGLPITVFLEADGTVAHVQSGELRDVAQLEALVAEHLGVRP